MVPHPAQVLDVVEQAAFFATLEFAIGPNLAGTGKVFQIVAVKFLLEVREINAEDILELGLKESKAKRCQQIQDDQDFYQCLPVRMERERCSRAAVGNP